jgi:hypothetical protein
MAGDNQREDADDLNEEEELDENDQDEVARRAAARIAAEQPDPPDPPDDEDPDPDTQPTDEDVQEWLSEVVQTPEIKEIIRSSAREIAEKSGTRTARQITNDLMEKLETRLKSFEAEIKSGNKTREDLDEDAQRLAEEEAARARNRSNGNPPDDDADEERKKLEKRQQEVRTRETKAYARERLSQEDTSKLIAEVVVVRDDTTEDDVDDMIDDAKAAYGKTRTAIVKELRAQGWRSPEDLLALAREGRRTRTGGRGSQDPPAPPSRDKQESGLTDDRKSELRERFNYGNRRESSSTR